MDLARKLELAKTSVASISRHDDEPQEAVKSTLSQLVSFINEEMAAASTRRRAAADALARKNMQANINKSEDSLKDAASSAIGALFGDKAK
jgi:LPS O-antigen subunit length determinant protein (WzzB/FepE family)